MHLEELEKHRKAIRNKVLLSAVLLAGGLAGVKVLTGDRIDDLFLVFGWFVTFGILKKFLTLGYGKDFKSRVIGSLVHSMNGNLDYRPGSHLSRETFEQSGLFPQRIDRFDGNDLVEGEIEGVLLRFSDVVAKKKTEDAKGKTSWQVLFRGLFIVSESNKDFQGRTVVLPDTAESMFGSLVGGWLQSKNPGRDPLVRMDDPEFEKKFVVYGTDQIEARYLLTPAMMKRLLAFREERGCDVYVSFVDSHINLAVSYDDDLFEAPLFSSLLDRRKTMEYIETMMQAIGVVEELQLHRKLWSKR